MRQPFAAWIERDVIRVSGPDAASYLQGQASQDVAAVAVGASAWSLLLQPNGKVDAWVRLTRVDEPSFELDVDGGWGDNLVQRLTRFKLRTNCEIEPVDGVRCLAIRNTRVDAPEARAIVWPGVEGVDLVGAEVTGPDGVELADSLTYERARIEAGVPALGRELTSATVPADAGQWLLDASVSFTKGCYTGQELVARMDARGGNAPRPVRGLRVDGIVSAGDPVLVAGERVGELTSVAPGADGTTVALAPLPRAVVPGTSVEVGGRSGDVVELPMA